MNTYETTNAANVGSQAAVILSYAAKCAQHVLAFIARNCLHASYAGNSCAVRAGQLTKDAQRHPRVHIQDKKYKQKPQAVGAAMT